MRKVRVDYLRVCSRCGKFYRGVKFSKVCVDCSQKHIPRAGWHRDKNIEAFLNKIKLRDTL